MQVATEGSAGASESIFLPTSGFSGSVWAAKVDYSRLIWSRVFLCRRETVGLWCGYGQASGLESVSDIGSEHSLTIYRARHHNKRYLVGLWLS